MQFITRPGPYCRDCGIATYRDLTVESALMGWYGLISVIVNPFIMLQNIGAARRINKLPPPIPGAPRPPLNPGKPLLRRAGMLGVLIPIVLGTLLAVGLVRAEERSASSAAIGDCVVNRNGNKVDDDHPDVEKISCTDPAAMGKIIAKVAGSKGSLSAGELQCAKYPTTEFVYVTEEYTLCLASPR